MNTLERVYKQVLFIAVLAVLCAVFVKGVMILDANRHAKTYNTGYEDAKPAYYNAGYKNGWNAYRDRVVEYKRRAKESEERMKLEQSFLSGTTSGQIWMRNEN